MTLVFDPLIRLGLGWCLAGLSLDNQGFKVHLTEKLEWFFLLSYGTLVIHAQSQVGTWSQRLSLTGDQNDNKCFKRFRERRS